MQSQDETPDWPLQPNLSPNAEQTSMDFEYSHNDLADNFLDPTLFLLPSAMTYTNNENDRSSDKSTYDGLPPLADPYISDLVFKHGCLRQSQRCARQLRDYWVPTLPPALRGINIDSAMAACVRLGKRMYQGRDERQVADAKWLAYCSARDSEIKCRAHLAKGATHTFIAAAPGPPSGAVRPPPLLQQKISPPPPRKEQPPPQLYEPPSQENTAPPARAMYIIWASEADLQLLNTFIGKGYFCGLTLPENLQVASAVET